MILLAENVAPGMRVLFWEGIIGLPAITIYPIVRIRIPAIIHRSIRWDDTSGGSGIDSASPSRDNSSLNISACFCCVGVTWSLDE